MGKLWFGGPIYTMEQEDIVVDAVFTQRNKIIAIGTYEYLYHTYYNEIEEAIHLQGKTMLPGFIDSHLHIVWHGEKLLRLDLSAMQSADEVLEALSNRSVHLSKGEWLVGEGWNENHWEEPLIIHKSALDEIIPDNPVMLSRVCRHAVLANSKAMELAKIDYPNNTEDPQGGVIIRDNSGETTGYFLDTAQELIKQAMPSVSQAYLEQVISIAISDLTAKGLVGGHSEDLNYFGGFEKTYRAFTNAINEENKFKAHLLVHHEVMQDAIQAGLGELSSEQYVELGAIKIFSDGALGGRTAWLTNDYSDDKGNCGFNIHSTAELERIVQDARKYRLPVAVHAIGDQAILEVASTLKKYPLPNKWRDRIIHGQILNPQSLQLLKELPAIIDIQPSFVASDFPWVIDRLGEKRLDLSYAWKTMLANGIHCAGGSDAPIEEVNPLYGIEAAVLRKSSYDGKRYLTKEALSIFEAVQLYTTGSAYAINQEDTRGLIAEGYAADFTIIDQDIFHVNPHDIHRIGVEMTVIDGEIVYVKNPSST
ncbi:MULTISPECIES: amidohydrolase [Virgibacillus]|uniref:N-substituted formamide deformylase n=1 Tax=Virgibacillus massiliensis TaxID=1462526 RepID=A0A024QBI3_9BACI|nr:MULTISPECIES: amidohydrolase [Virgibacillus]CDQ39306.1 N-substituted formamide deformylase precursor [Virgibacillus massiliensis]